MGLRVLRSGGCIKRLSVQCTVYRLARQQNDPPEVLSLISFTPKLYSSPQPQTLNPKLYSSPQAHVPSSENASDASSTVWFLVGNGGMDYGDYYWGFYRDYYRDPFPHSLLRTRQSKSLRGCTAPCLPLLHAVFLQPSAGRGAAVGFWIRV